MMTSLVRELPLPQVLGDIEIAQTLKKNQEEASQQLEVIISEFSVNSLQLTYISLSTNSLRRYHTHLMSTMSYCRPT